MNNIFQGSWEEIKGKIKKTWGKFTDDELLRLKGNQQEIFGLLQKHYGYTQEQAKKALKDFESTNKH